MARLVNQLLIRPLLIPASRKRRSAHRLSLHAKMYLAIYLSLLVGSTPALADGYWTQCIVFLINGPQIAVINASSQPNCSSAGQKCAHGRPFSSINWYGNPILSSSNPVEVCSTPY